MNDDDNFDLKQQTITPYFTVQNADRMMDFLMAAFGAKLVKENRYDDNSIQHARPFDRQLFDNVE